MIKQSNVIQLVIQIKYLIAQNVNTMIIQFVLIVIVMNTQF